MLADKFRNYIKKLKEKLYEDIRWIYISICVFIFLFVLIILPSSFAGVQPVKSVEIFSENLSYLNNEAGAWKVTESAKWISRDEAEVTIDVDSNLKSSSDYNDVLLVLDTSASMAGNKYYTIKNNIKNMINKFYTINNSKLGLITFNEKAEIKSNFTNNKDFIVNSIDSLNDPSGSSSYYQALLKVNQILDENYNTNNKNCTVVFLVGGVPNNDTPNEVAYYKYLKGKYSNVVFNTVQYGMGTVINDFVKNISDKQFISDESNLGDILFEASLFSVSYDHFEVTTKINDDNFSIVNIETNLGTYEINGNEILWNLKSYKSGNKCQMKIKVKLHLSNNDLYITTEETSITSSIGNVSENIMESKSTVLKDNYQVTYDGNNPNGCNVSDIPNTENRFVYDTVEISNKVPKCSGYQFKEWKLKTSFVNILNGDYFIMPEEDVVLRAEWSKIDIKKSVDGKIHEYVPPVLQSVTSSYDKEIWAYKSSITKVVFQDEFKDITGAIGEWDISEDKNLGVKGIIVKNSDNTTYTAYIQGDGKIMANTNSSYLFYNFSNLTSIEGLTNLDTSNVMNMAGMFMNCLNITGLDLTSFNTENVTTMGSMFNSCYKLENLNVSNFNTLKVTDMGHMFTLCQNLNKIDVSNFNTSKVINMDAMFGSCYKIVSLDLNNFDTSNVENMNHMFHACSNLTNLKLGNFNTSSLKTAESMFGLSPKIITTITIRSTKITNYTNIFTEASTNGSAKIIVNYTSATSTLVDNMIKTKSTNSNVVKGSRV